MNTVFRWLSAFVDGYYSAKDKSLHWRRTNAQCLAELKFESAIADQTLEGELKKKCLQLEQELALLKTRNTAELAMLKTKCRQDIYDYKQYLQALDKLKNSIQKSYAQLPEAVAFTIHHHAKALLHQMWEAENPEAKIRHEMQLIQFMAAVHEDARENLQSPTPTILPEKTLGLIQMQQLC